MRRSGALSVRALWLVVVLALVGGGFVYAEYEKARALYKAGKYAEAADAWSEAVSSAPDYAYGHSMLGNCYMRLKKYAEAEAPLRRAVELDPSRTDYQLNLALTLERVGKYAEVVTLLDGTEPMLAGAQHARSRAKLHKIRGFCLLRTGDHARAKADLEHCKPEKSHSVAAALARACVELEDLACARKASGQALALKPTDSGTQARLLRLLLAHAPKAESPEKAQGLYEEAIAVATAYLPHAKDEALAQGYLGAAQLGAKRYGDAVKAYARQVELSPGSCPSMLNAASAEAGRAAELGDAAGPAWEAVLEWSRRAIDCNPSEITAHRKAAFALIKLQRWDEAVTAADAALALAPADPEAKRIKDEALAGKTVAAHNDAFDDESKRLEEIKRKQKEVELKRQKDIEDWRALQGLDKEEEKGSGAKDGDGAD